MWQLEDIWLKMAKVRVTWIAEGPTGKQPNTASSSPAQSEEPTVTPASFDYTGKLPESSNKSEHLMLVEDITADMRRTGQSTQDIVLFIKFLSSGHCEVIPAEVRKGDTLDSQMFQKGCADLVEMFDKQTYSGRNSLMSNKS